VSDLHLPHSLGWTLMGARPPGDAGIDGSESRDERLVRAFVEPLAPSVAENRFGVSGMDRPHFVMGGQDLAELREGDELLWEGRTLIVRAVRDFGEGAPHVEAVASMRTRGRA
jgi:hypothetical protein